jgi:hypothetical protein
MPSEHVILSSPRSGRVEGRSEVNARIPAPAQIV